MKKNLLLISSLLLALGNAAYAKVPNYKAAAGRSSSNNMQEIKFGPQIGISLAKKGGLFGEYKLNEALGVQGGFVYFSNIYFLDDAEVANGGYIFTKIASINMPVLLRAYPGNDRQFCWFGGFQLGYITSGKFNFISSTSLPNEEKVEQIKNAEDLLKNMNIDLKDINEQDKVRRFQMGIVAGFDYEFDFGLVTGLTYTKELIDVIKSKDSLLNWSLQLALGYNLGKFLK